MTTLKILKTEKEYNAALDRAITIFDSQPGSTEFNELEILGLLIKNYEDQFYPISLPNPIAAIKYKLDQKGLKHKDLVPYLGSEGHVSAILSGKRQLTINMARALVQFLGIPAEVLLG